MFSTRVPFYPERNDRIACRFPPNFRSDNTTLRDFPAEIRHESAALRYQTSPPHTTARPTVRASILLTPELSHEKNEPAIPLRNYRYDPASWRPAENSPFAENAALTSGGYPQDRLHFTLSAYRPLE